MCAHLLVGGLDALLELLPGGPSVGELVLDPVVKIDSRETRLRHQRPAGAPVVQKKKMKNMKDKITGAKLCYVYVDRTNKNPKNCLILKDFIPLQSGSFKTSKKTRPMAFRFFCSVKFL